MNRNYSAPGPGVDRRPKGGTVASDEATEQLPRQRGVEDSAGSDDSLVKQMSHGDESLAREGDTESRGVIGYVDGHGSEDRLEEGVREYDAE